MFSLEILKDHFKKIEKLLETYPTQFFLQIQVSKEASKSGILLSEIPDIWNLLNSFPLLKASIIGFSSIGTQNASPERTQKEMKDLLKLKKQYLPKGDISYGTSQDYKESIKEGSSVIRIGKALWD